MKIFKCGECGKYLGEMTQGKIHIKAFILCETCTESHKTFKSLADYNKSTKKDNPFNFDDFFGKNFNRQ